MSIIRNGLESVDLDVPVVLPTLNLDFANSQSLDKRITFTRGSIGTRVNRNGLIETIPANQPRFNHDPITGQSLGLLIEESRTNLLTYSEDFDDASWTKFGSSVSANVLITTAPDGSNNADKLIEDTTNGEHRFTSLNISWSGNTRYTFTIFVKATEITRVNLLFVNGENWSGGREVNFDLVTGTIVSTDGAVGNITKLPNGWYRCSATALTVASPVASIVALRMINTGTNVSYQGDGTSGLYIWGAQLEVGAFPTSYIPTTASTVTRSADLASMRGTNFSSWYRQDEGTFYADVLYGADISGMRLFYTRKIADGFSTRHGLVGGANNGSTTGPYGETFVSSVLQAALNQGAPVANTRYLTAYAAKKDYFAFTRNGATDSVDTRGDLPLTQDQALIGSDGSGNNLNGTISRLTYYPKALSPSQLQYLTQ